MQMRKDLHGPVRISQDARHMLDMIYKTWPDLEDQRFKHYSTRRFTHLLKLSLICAATRVSMSIEAQDVMLANTALAHAEMLMPKALGELGKSRSSEAANKIMQALYNARAPMDMSALWKVARMDLDKPADLIQVVANLRYADQIQEVTLDDGKIAGYLPKVKSMDRKILYIDPKLLRERN